MPRLLLSLLLVPGIHAPLQADEDPNPQLRTIITANHKKAEALLQRLLGLDKDLAEARLGKINPKLPDIWTGQKSIWFPSQKSKDRFIEKIEEDAAKLLAVLKNYEAGKVQFAQAPTLPSSRTSQPSEI